MLSKIFPSEFNNEYRGNKIALYFFYLLTAVTLWRSQHHIFSEDGGAQSIATIPLDRFTEDGANTVVGIFSMWGLSQLIIGLIYLMTIIRYKSMIPLMYLFMFIEYGVRYAYIGNFKSIATAGTAPGGSINLPFTVLALVMMMLSVYEGKKKD